MTRLLPVQLGMLTILFISSIGCATHPKQTFSTYEKNVGVVVASSEKVCLTIGDSVPDNAIFAIVDTQSQQRYEAAVRMPADECLDQGARDLGLRGYRVTLKQQPSTPFLGIAVVGVSPSFRTAGGLAIADLDDDQHDEYFRSCTSAEGVHFTVWSDQPLTGKRRWHRYYPLGYDVSPTCTPAEMDAR
jgi:hypothetical protein